MTLSENFARYICQTKLTENDQETIETVKSRIIDYIAVTSAVTYYSDLPSKLMNYVHNLSVDTDAEKGSYPVTTAGFLNAAFAHGLDYDDGHLWAGIHAAGPVIGTAFALAPKHKPNGKLFLEAITLGYEIEYRLGKALGKSHIQKGFHGSCTCGVIGAAVTAGKILGLNEKQMTYAIGLAGLGAFGIRQPLTEGQMSKPIQVGYVAEKGIEAALLASNGVEAPLQIFEGKNGLFSIFSDTPKQQIVDACLADLGKRHLVNDTYTKLFPCCRYTHAAIEASFKLIKVVPDLKAIQEIVVNTFDIAIEATAPNQSPSTIAQARFSMNYLLATALHQGFVGLDDFTDEAIKREDIRETAKKVKAYSTKEWNDKYPDIRGAEIVINTNDGKSYSQKIDRLSGMSGDHEEVRRKFRNACKKVYSPESLQTIIDWVAKIENCTNVSELMLLCNERKL
ncbi:2-methylcitrate dehydratase PrpD [Sporomusaceae bacterium BoRhaA]|uniref:MmgE/PrpD family protein n=1 Tax=Pelorhabdus rhamnosifermentans TaxID=2772457 RepID=UPI001C062CD0|nr:MmgE/PrpD family protein [Pelorhabdus rhamnosifermentans]MBU2699638.1 2-methylcitrate dehydratase PrpD [Pelorhabdus rhamnosifermentans]